MKARDLTLELPHLSLAAREWGDPEGPPVLALHGWLDNAATFDRLAPLLPELHLIALDLPGHGLSAHRPPAPNLHFIDFVPEVAGAARSLGWERFSLIGHSMGAGISSMMPGAYPGRIERVVLLEGVGPLSSRPEKTPARLAAALAEEERLTDQPARTFTDLEHAARARALGNELNLDTARLLVERGAETTAEGVRFRHDPRLKLPSRMRASEEQVRSLLAAVDCPVLAVRARDGWPFPEELLAARLGAIPDLQAAHVDGGHHVHLTHPERVAPLIRDFLLGRADSAPIG